MQSSTRMAASMVLRWPEMGCRSLCGDQTSPWTARGTKNWTLWVPGLFRRECLCAETAVGRLKWVGRDISLQRPARDGASEA